MHRHRDSSTSSSDPVAEPGAIARIGRTVGLVALGAALTVGAALGWAWQERVWLTSLVPKAGIADAGLLAGIARWRQEATRRQTPPAVLLGNSLTQCQAGASIGPVVDRLLRARGRPHALGTVWSGAFGPLQYYYLLDEVLAAKPRFAIVEVDFVRAGFALVAPHLRYVTLSRLLSTGQAVRVRRALAGDGLTLFDPFLFRLEAEMDVIHVVPGLQQYWRDTVDAAGTWMNDALGLRAVPVVDPGRPLQKDRARDIFGASTETNAQVLREIARALREAGVPMLFYVSPLNVELLDELGVRAELGLAGRAEALRREIGLAKDEWLDLHALLPARAFRDWLGHLEPAGCARVGAAITDALLARPDASVAAAAREGAAR